MVNVLRARVLRTAVLSVALVASKPAHAAQMEFTNTGGAVSIDASNNLVLANSNLSSPVGTVALTCPLTTIPPSPYEATWSCTGGSFSVQSTDGSTGVNGTFTSGTLTEEAVGGGKGNPVRYLYTFTGNFTGTSTTNGQTQPITGVTTQSLAAMTSHLGTGTINNGTTFINTVYAQTYVADTYNNRIVRIDDMTGTNWIAFGTAGGQINQFIHPWGIAVDEAGRIYVADSGNNRIVRIDDMVGTNWTEFGTPGSGTGQFNNPSGVFVDTAGKIYVADAGNGRIARMDDMAGTNWTTFGAVGSETNQFNSPLGVFVDTLGKIYVADTYNSRIVRTDDMSGTNWVALGSSGALNQFNNPSGVSVDTAGKIYVVDTVNDRIVRMDDMLGTNFRALGSIGAGAGQFVNPYAMFVDPSGTIYVADTNNGRIARFDDLSGANWTTFGSYGVGDGTFDGPSGIALQAAPEPAPCAGACDGTRAVAVDDILVLVNIALGNAEASVCPYGIPSGRQVDVALIIQAVNNALNGCTAG